MGSEVAKAKNKPPIWKRRYLVQKTYQIRYSLLIASIGAIALILAFYSIKYIVLTDLLPISVPNISLYKVTGFMFISWFFLGVIYTHTTAGPITQLINQINNVADNKLDEAKVVFRRGDDLQDLPEYFNNMVKVLQFRQGEEALLYKEIKSHLNQALDKYKQETNKSQAKTELLDAMGYCVQRVQNLIQKKNRYLGKRNLGSRRVEGAPSGNE